MRRAERARRSAYPARAGVALLEAMIALTVLASAGAAVVALTAQSAQAVRQARGGERALREAGAFLDAVALWTRDDLDRRLGTREQHPWRMRVDRPTPTLYVVVLTDSAGARELLRTSLYRPEAPGAAP